MFRLLFLLIPLLATTSALAQPLPRTPRILAEPATVDSTPLATLDYPGGVTAWPGVSYYQPSGYNRLTMDIYASNHSGREGRRPLIVFVHGGGWMSGHSRQSGAFADFPDVLASIAQTGYVVASINYRLSGEAPSPAAVQDAKVAIRWLRAHADDYGIDPQRVGIWGASAGGQIAGLVATSCGVQALSPDVTPPPGAVDGEGRPLTSVLPDEVAAQSDCVQAATLWYAGGDFVSMLDGVPADQVPPPLVAYLDCPRAGCTPEVLARASVKTYVDHDDPPMLLVHGDADTSAPVQLSVELANVLETAGVEHELVILPGINHSLIGDSLEATQEASQQALTATLAFFARTLKTETSHMQPLVIPLYSGVAPGSENAQQNEVTFSKDGQPYVRNVVQPTLTAFLPDKAKANGTAVIVAPGGGFMHLAMDKEGSDVARWLQARGVAAFVLKYRLMDTGATDEEFGKFQAALDGVLSPDAEQPAALVQNPGLQNAIEIAVADGQQAMRIVRERAAEWGIAPDRIGMIGFSAGGMVTLGAVMKNEAASRPDFAAPIYSGYVGDATIAADAPPLFIAVADDDPIAAESSANLYLDWRRAGRNAELHVYATGGHGFGSLQRGLPVDGWLDRFGEWLQWQGLLEAPQ